MKTMYILDPGMDHVHGHHYMWNSLLREELRQRGVEVHFLVHSCFPGADAGVIPLFQYSAYLSDAVLSEPGQRRDIASNIARELQVYFEDKDLSNAVLFFHTCNNVYLNALTLWYDSFPAERRPDILVNFHRPFGFDLFHKDFTYGAATPELAQYFSSLLNLPVCVLPIAINVEKFASSTVHSPCVFGVAGCGSANKNFEYLPHAMLKYMQFGGGGHFRIQLANLPWSNIEAVFRQLRFMAKTCADRVQYTSDTLHGNDFYAHVTSCDCMLLPYTQGFTLAYSQVLSECIAMNIPAIVANNTSLADAVLHADNGSIILASVNENTLCDAMLQFEEECLARRQRAFEAGARYRAFNNISNLVDTVLQVPTAVACVF